MSASATLIGLVLLSRELTGLPLSLGAGYEVLEEWLFVEADIALWLLIAVFIIRSFASAATLVGGGVGGVFIPLVVGGAIVGRAVGEVVHPERFSLYTLIGIAAFLGAGYRVPLAAVMFVAESTGRPNFICCALRRSCRRVGDGGTVDYCLPAPPRPNMISGRSRWARPSRPDRQVLPNSGMTTDHNVAITAEMQGTIVTWEVTAGTPVRQGQVLGMLESMKLHHDIVAHTQGVLSAVAVEVGSTVKPGDVIASINASSEAQDGSEEAAEEVSASGPLGLDRPDLSEVVERHAIGLMRLGPERWNVGERTSHCA